MRTREYIAKGERNGKSLVDAMRDGGADGMQEFDDVLERMAGEGVITLENALTYATNRNNLKLKLSDLARAGQTTDDGLIALAPGHEAAEA